MAGPPRYGMPEIVTVESAGDDCYSARLESFEGAAFGGETLARAVAAAAHTCDDRPMNSLHACFLRRVPPDCDVELRVERTSEGRRLARRRVVIEREGRLLFEAWVSFAAPGTSFDFQELDADEVPRPEEIAPEEQIAREEGWDEDDWGPGPLEMRWVGRPWDFDEGRASPSRYSVWARPRIPLPDTPGAHAAALAYLADLHSHWPVARRLGLLFGAAHFASLDQSVWVHRDACWDDWWLLTSHAPVSHAGRTLGHRTVHALDGSLVASMAQEAMILGAPEPDGG